MRVCMIVPHFLPHVGGGEQLYFDIAKGLQEKGHEVRVITSSSAGITGNVPYKGIDSYYFNWKMFCGHPIVKARDIEEHIKWADLVHTTVFTTATKSRIISKKYKKKCIITIHEVLGNKWFWIEDNKIKALMFDIYERLICKQKFDAYHVVSDATKRDYEKFCGKTDKIYRIYNSVDLPSFEKIRDEKITIKDYFGIKEDEKCFLFFGRPAVNKGIFVLEEAIKKLNKKNLIPSNIKFCWLIARDPAPRREQLLDLLKKHDLEVIVKVMPSVKRNELFKLIMDADYVIIPSITEGFGFCAVEACSLEKKVLYSSGGSLPEVVYGKCLEFENMNSDDLANKIENIINMDEDAFEDIEVKHFEKNRMVNEIIDMYESTV